jgi:GNAT superfamily N-acetyltransferase
MTDHLALPPGNSPTLALVQPTEEERGYQFRLNGAEWRGALTLAAYLRREEVLSHQDLTRHGGITWWILVDQAAEKNPLDPSSSLRLPLASCETYRKRALVWQDGKVLDTICHGIGSVFCAKDLRGRGYAARLMQEVGKVLRTWQADEQTPCMSSVLFSDIGKVRTQNPDSPPWSGHT